MKTIYRQLIGIILFILFYSGNIEGQNPVCGNTELNHSKQTDIIDCTKSSDTWANIYKTKEHYKPDIDMPIKTLHVNINIWQRADGTGNLSNIPVHISRLKQIMEWVNIKYEHVNPNALPSLSYSVESFTDSKIRIVLDSIYFYQDPSSDSSYYYGGYGNQTLGHNVLLDNFILSNFPERTRALNIHLTGSVWPGIGGYSDYGSIESFYRRNPDMDGTTAHDYWFSEHWAHEIGHSFDLWHTYDSNWEQNCSLQYYDFLTDLYDITVPCQDGCEICLITGNNNNLMGGASQGHITGLQMGIIHRSTMLRNLHNMNYNLRDHVTGYNSSPYEINQDETWDFSIKVYQDIFIKAGNTLTIKCEVQMVPNSKIVIEQNAKLIIDGGKITNEYYYNKPWQGIEIWGNKYAHQFPGSNGSYYQGYLELKNGATIENAVTAVELWKPNDWATTGGIVVANGAIFRNNACSVHALDYRNFMPNAPVAEVDNVSQFTNCSFEITPDYPGDVTFYKHIDLSKVKGVKFKGCDFSLSPNVTGVSEWNQAIASYNAGFSVDAVITSQLPNIIYDNCTFNGFYSGIYATTSQVSTNSFYVNRADFTDNSYGLKALNVHNFTIINSNFNIGCNNSTESAICTGVPGYGIHLDNSSGFAIEENHFTKAANAPSANYYGIYVKNTHSQDIIYKNYFNGLSNGNYAEQVNYGYYPYLGLKYFCNSNENNYSDFYVQKDDPSGIQSGQGSTTYSAGNTFSNNATWHFYNGGNNLIDYYYSTINCTDCDPNVSKLYRVTKHLTNQSNSCASHYGSSSSNMVILSENQKAERELLFADALTDYAGVKSLYDNLKDGGSTASTLTDIQSAQPQEMWSLRSKLLGDSPHLSVDVLKQVANKTDVFTEAAIFDILAANPDELKNEELLKYLEEKDSPLPEYMIDILRQVATGITYKSVLQQEMARYEQIRTLAANDMIRSIINDSVTDLVQLRNWLDNKGGIESDKQIVATYAEEGNFEAAFTLANILPTLYNLQGEELQEHANYIQLLDLEFNLMSQNRHIVALDSTELAVLNTFADSSKQASGAASKGILETYYGNHYCNCPEIVSEASYKNTYVDPNSINKIYGLEINAKPNPAKDWAAFDYTLPENATNASLIITDELGKTIETFILLGQQGQQLWDTRSIGAGNYIYTLKVDGYNASGKIVISK